jgi:tubulin polyglutamylase TTLL1
MNSIRKLKDKGADPECIRNASFIPDTYRMNDKEDCVAFFEYLNSDVHEKNFLKYGP